VATLTPSQMRVVDFIRRFRVRQGYAPTLDEIAGHLGVIKATVQTYLRTLSEKGVIRRRKYAHRSLEVVESALPESERRDALPLVGRVAAGEPIDAIEEREWVDVGDVLGLSRARESLYLLQVKGDSMIDDGIFDGDYVIVERRNTARNGETVVALMPDDTATVKRFYGEKGRIRLQPANERMKPIPVRDVSIRGVVRGVLRSL